MLYNYISKNKRNNIKAPECNKLFEPGSNFKNFQPEIRDEIPPRTKPNKYLGIAENGDDKNAATKYKDNKNYNNKNDNPKNDDDKTLNNKYYDDANYDVSQEDNKEGNNQIKNKQNDDSLNYNETDRPPNNKKLKGHREENINRSKGSIDPLAEWSDYDTDDMKPKPKAKDKGKAKNKGNNGKGKGKDKGKSNPIH